MAVICAALQRWRSFATSEAAAVGQRIIHIISRTADRERLACHRKVFGEAFGTVQKPRTDRNIVTGRTYRGTGNILPCHADAKCRHASSRTDNCRAGSDQTLAARNEGSSHAKGIKRQHTLIVPQRATYATRADRLNGHTAEVVAIDPQGSSLLVQRQDGEREMLDMTHLADRHLRHGWVRTIHSAQGATSDRVLAHVESYRANIVDARAIYVAISRARKLATLYTDSRDDLTEALGVRDGAQVGAIDQTKTHQREGAAIGM